MSSILDAFKLDGKAAIVTGANKGLGQAIALGLAEAGANIIAVARGDLGETVDRVSSLGRKAVAVNADLGDRSTFDGIFEAGKAEFGGVDILVNNAGIIRRDDFTNFSEKDWDEVMRVNIDAVFFLSQRFARQCLERHVKGKIINVASMLSFQGGIRVPSYTASKSAVMGLTRLMACELGPKGLTANAIAPGYMATDNTQQLRDDAVRNKAILERIPVGRWGSPDDLKGAAVFLASSASDYVNGYTIAVDGGWLAR